MIFDRTQNDVDTAIRLRNEKVKFDPITMQPINPEALTESEIATLEKGTMTVNTINRIDDKQTELKNLFNSMGYWNTPIKIYQEWKYSHIFSKKHFQILIDNTDILRKAFFVYMDTPNTPPISYHYSDINALEKILYDLDVMISSVKANYRFCGEFECGEE